MSRASGDGNWRRPYADDVADGPPFQMPQFPDPATAAAFLRRMAYLFTELGRDPSLSLGDDAVGRMLHSEATNYGMGRSGTNEPYPGNARADAHYVAFVEHFLNVPNAAAELAKLALHYQVELELQQGKIPVDYD